MSKYVKELVTRDIRRRLDGVDDAVLVNCVGMDANTTNELRGELDKRDIKLLVVKNSLACRAKTHNFPRLSRELVDKWESAGLFRFCLLG